MSHWLLPTLCSALFLGLYDLSKKHGVRNNPVLPVLFWATFFGSLLFVAATLATGHFTEYWHCTGREYLLVWIKTFIVCSSWYFGYWALSALPISIVAPVRSTAPLWTCLAGILLYHEIPNARQALGMLLIFAGYHGFTLLGHQEGFSLRKSRGMQFVILATLLGAASAIFDKYLIGQCHLSPRMVQLHFSINQVILFGAALAISRTRQGANARTPMEWRWTIPAIGILLILADFAYFHAVSLPDSRISMVAIVRRSSCIITFFAGAAIFHDKNVLKKSLALLPIILGVLLLVKK